jgi:hypothetical protein
VARIARSLSQATGRRLVGALLGVVFVAVIAACGTSSQSKVATLASWRDSYCSIVKSHDKAMEAAEPTGDDAPAYSPETTRRQLKAMRNLVVELRKIPPPPGHGAEVESLLDLFAAIADNYEQAIPRIDAAGRRFEQVLKTIDPDGDLPPAPKGATVAGGIMSQMMSIPGVRDAWTELMASYEAAASGIDEEEGERLSKVLGLEQCEERENAEERPTAAELARCGARGAPVSLQTLVDVFRANDISLHIEEETCSISEQARVDGARPDATNASPSGLSQTDEVELKEGYILCSVEDESFGKKLAINKYDTDTETSLAVLNISCTIYPHSASTEAAQIARVKKAMKAVAEIG